MILKSQAFRKNHPIPRVHSQEGRDISPPLEWSDAPPDTKSFALVCEDPDAPREEPFVHWMIYNIPASVERLPQAVPRQSRLQTPLRADQGKSSQGGIGYVGPMPPVGHGVHHYIFRLYALDVETNLRPGIASADELLEALEEHVIDVAQLVGTYVRTGEARKAG